MMQAKDINDLLKKTQHYDKDERYMATSDIISVLKREGRGGLDEHLESRICTAVLKQVSLCAQGDALSNRLLTVFIRVFPA